jgi:hypothetical protein
VKQVQLVPVPVEKIIHVQKPHVVERVVIREVVKQVPVPHEIVQKVEHIEHVVQPVEVVEEPVVQEIVTVNKRTVKGQPYVANTTTNVVGVDGGAGFGAGLGAGFGAGFGGIGLGGFGLGSALGGSYLGSGLSGSCVPALPLCL